MVPPVYVIGEDALCCALGLRLAQHVWGHSPTLDPINTQGVTHLRERLTRFRGLARIGWVLCLADSDGKCCAALRQSWLPAGRADPRFLLRFAESTSESWIMADRAEIARFLRVAESRLPRNPDLEANPKRTMLSLARASRVADLRREMATANAQRPGPGYNLHLSRFVREHWRPESAAEHSPSLARALLRLRDCARVE